MRHIIIVLMGLLSVSMVTAETLEVPIIEQGIEGLDTCLLGKVVRLKAGGDGFLAVRTGPGSNFKKLGEVHNGDRVWVYEEKGQWFGIIYGEENPGCGPVEAKRRLPYKGKKGWVHNNWVDIIAG